MNAIITSTDVQAQIKELEARQREIDELIAADEDDSDLPALAHESSVNASKLRGLGLRLQTAQTSDKITLKEDMLKRFRTKTGELYALYVEQAQIDAEIDGHQKAINSLAERQSALRSQQTLEGNRRGKLMTEALGMGIKAADLDVIRREFPAIPKYW